MRILDRLLEISPERLEAGGARVDRYLASKNAVLVGGAAISLGVAIDAVGSQWGATLAFAGTWVGLGGGGLMASESDRLRMESQEISSHNR